MDLGLNGKTALVLGASRGLGAAVAQSLAAEGVHVFAAARSLERTNQWIGTLPPDLAQRIEARCVDLTDIATVDVLVDNLPERGVDILINNSGGPALATAMTASRQQWLDYFEPMAANLIHLTQRLVPAMVARQWGRVVTITSSGIEQPIPGLALSTGIRLAVVGWSKTLASEVAAQGVTVNVVLPGRFTTERVAELDANNAAIRGTSVEEARQASTASIPAQRYGRPEELADAVTFLASVRASYITGAKIRVDGGSIRAV